MGRWRLSAGVKPRSCVGGLFVGLCGPKYGLIGSPACAFELEGFGPGQTCNATFDMEPGMYTTFCIITTDGQTHYELGMRGTATVS